MQTSRRLLRITAGPKTTSRRAVDFFKKKVENKHKRVSEKKKSEQARVTRRKDHPQARTDHAWIVDSQISSTNHQSSIVHQSPKTNPLSPSTNHQPITIASTNANQSPSTTNHQSSIIHQSPTNHQASPTNHQSSITMRQSSFTNHQPITLSACTNRNGPFGESAIATPARRNLAALMDEK